MKPALQLRLGQTLTLTPQLRQAIRLLQLSGVELETEITAALESNPMLERLENDEAEGPALDDPPIDAEQGPGEEELPDLDIPSWASEHPVPPQGSAGEPWADDRNPALAAPDRDLHGHLHWQLELLSMPDRDRAMAIALIDAVNDDGYLAETLESLREGLLPDLEVSLDELASVLRQVQALDPPGVGARSLSECLGIQLAQQPAGPVQALAARIAADHLEALARDGPERLASRLDTPTQAVAEAVTLLRSLAPRPGAAWSTELPGYIIPDAYAVYEGGAWEARPGPGTRHRLGINAHYCRLIPAASERDASYLRNQLQEARWLIRSLETRADTILRVAEAIVHHQRGFLDYGPEAMRPLILRDLAEELELHESTISRVTTNKYLRTPRGTFEFKYFFSSSLTTVDGGTASGTAIQAMLQRLIESENPRKPLSDAALARALAAEGVSVARRTVAKYREILGLAPSTERRRLP